MSDKEKALDSLAIMITPDNLQKYILGYKKNGQQRALYDIVKDLYLKKKKKNKKNKSNSKYSVYLKKKNKKKKNKHWHI